ncbi:MAG: hypothetical protein LUD02_03860 [Tannerellaceae bacterium]|nr:hypothetical protein [Tannerellaceae bacterium]
MIEYHENSIETFAIEVELKFDASQVTLSCGFDAAKRCDKILCTWIILKKI